MQSKKLLVALFACIFIFACKQEKELQELNEFEAYVEPEDIYEFGFNLNDYIVKRDTIKPGDSFGVIMERNKLGYPEIFKIVQGAKDSFNIRKLQVGKPYTLLCSKDSLEIPKFINLIWKNMLLSTFRIPYMPTVVESQ